jgi:SAM-dependent methyltransferase
MAAHSGALYVGTLDVTVFLRYVDWTQRRPDSRRAMSSQGDVAAMVDNLAGCELWCTFDGTRWEPVTRTGFGNPYNYGARTLQATEHGLFVGTANPFGPQVAVGNPGGGWAYVDNPEGGLEVWRLRAAPRVPGSRQEAPPRDRVDLGESLSTYSQLVDRFYESSGFSHLGLWRTDTTTQREACENLMEELLGFLPHTVGTILDAAPGEGATTRHLTRYFSPDAVTGISSSPQKLERCRYNAPGCRFLLMDATDLEFPDGSFDHVICAEAAFRFNTRADFLREALRVLEPGGRLVLSDVLITPLGHAGAPRWLAANRVPSPAAYAELLGRAGFTEVRVRDATLECWRRHLRHRVARAVEEFLDGNIDPRMLDTLKSRLLAQLAMVSYYVLASGCKPGQRTP